MGASFLAWGLISLGAIFSKGFLAYWGVVAAPPVMSGTIIKKPLCRESKLTIFGPFHFFKAHDGIKTSKNT